MIALLLLFVRLASAETLWAASAAEGARWPDAAVVTVRLEPGDEVEVLARKDDKVRVRKGVDFGWVAATALTAVAPAAPAPDPTAEGGALPDFTVTPAEPAAP